MYDDLVPDSLQKRELREAHFIDVMERVKQRTWGRKEESSTRLQRFQADSVMLEELLVALAKDGAVIVTGVLDLEQLQTIKDEMAPYLKDRAYGPDNFFGTKTKRVGALVARAPSTWDIAACPLVLQVCSAVLGHQVLNPKASESAAPGYKTHPWNLDLTQVIDIESGESNQTLHRDRWAYIFDFETIEPRISTMWAIDDFTAANGATRVIPGSHAWPRDRFPNRKDNVVQAEMPAGSVMIYTGSTWHSGGENKSGKSRYGINVDYSVAWLKQEENQFLSCPPNLAKILPQRIQELLGYSRSGYALGYVAGGFPPSSSWTAKKTINWATPENRLKTATGSWKPRVFAKL